jgi:DNA-binding LacI/PurR family transcriptional regulator
MEGVTTITTDFAAMGRNMADMIINGKQEHIENPSSLILRGSI